MAEAIEGMPDLPFSLGCMKKDWDVMTNAKQTAVAIIRRVLAEHGVAVVEILLFGSRARGEEGPESDWDFYVLTDRELPFAVRRELITRIRRELARRRIPNDVKLSSAERFKRMKDVCGHLAYEVAREGVPVE